MRGHWKLRILRALPGTWSLHSTHLLPRMPRVTRSIPGSFGANPKSLGAQGTGPLADEVQKQLWPCRRSSGSRQKPASESLARGSRM